MATGGVGALTVSLGLDAAEFTNGLNKAEQQASQFADQVKAIAAGTAIGKQISDFADQAARALYQLTIGSIDAADHLNDLSKKTGIAVETLGGIGFAAGQAGGNLDSASAAAGKLNKSLAEAAAGNKEAGEAFKALGINVKDAAGNTKSADVALVEIANKFATYADGPEKAALALKIFGKAGADIIPLLDDGGRALQENIEYYKRFSGVTTDLAKKADDFNDTIGKVQLINKSLGSTIAADILPVLQSLADAYLEAKEKSELFKTISAVIRTVLETVVVIGSEVAFVFSQIGQAIGAVAAGADALARRDFSGVKTIFNAYNEQAAEARKNVDAFQKSVLNVDQPNQASYSNEGRGKGKGKGNAPRLSGAGADAAAKEAAAALKKRLDEQIKIIQDFGRAQADAYKFGESYLEGVYQDGLISQRTFFDTQKQVRDAALRAQLDSFDKEIAAQRKFANDPVAKGSDRTAAEEKIKLLVQQRSEAVTKASAADILATQKNASEVANLADQYVSLSAAILEASGDTFGAQALKNAQEVAKAAKLISDVGGDRSVVDKRAAQLELGRQAAQQQKEYAKLLDDTARRESEIYLEAQAGGKGELETLAAIRDARQVAIIQLQQQAEAAAALAAQSGTDADIKRANDLALALKKAGAEIDPLATKFNSLFEDSFANAFTGFLNGTKSAKDAFKDFANSVISEIARIAARNLAKSLFGDTGGSSGIGGLLSKLFGAGGTTSGGGAGFYSGTPTNASTVGMSLAVGTNYVPYDGFRATLHKGEAVVPAKFNPANGGRMGGVPNVSIHNYGGSEVQTQVADDGSLQVLIDKAADAGYRKGVSDLASGTGDMSKQLRNRHGVGPGNLAKRK